MAFATYSSLVLCLLAVLSCAKEQEPRQAAESPTTPYLPLTTTFTPPSNCFTDVSLLSGIGYPISYSVGFGAGNEVSDCSPCWLGLATTSTCFPSGYSSSAIYSPGSCPSNYYVACSSINSIGTVTETVATCCPRGYFCAPESRILAFPWYSAQPCSFFPNSDLSISALSVGPATTITTEFPASIAPGFAILANSIQIRWQSVNVIPATTTTGSVPSNQNSISSSASSNPPTVSSSSSTASSTSSTASSSSPASSNAEGSKVSGLSTGAKAGIGVAVAIGAIGTIFGIVAIILLRRRRTVSDQTTNSSGEATGNNGVSKSELETRTNTHPSGRGTHIELDTVGRSELDTSPMQELPTR